MNTLTEMVITLGMGIITLAIINSLVSPRAQTTQVAQAVFSGFGNDLAVAQAPVTGASVPIDLSYPSSFAHSFGV